MYKFCQSVIRVRGDVVELTSQGFGGVGNDERIAAAFEEVDVVVVVTESGAFGVADV